MSEYKESKRGGDIGENQILKRLNKKFSKAFIDNRGKANSDWDIYIPEINEGVEVKNDYKSKETTRLVIEVEFDGILSALSVTKAKWWVFITGYEYIWITPLEIYRFLEQHIEYGRAKFKGDGDNKFKMAYLIGLKVFTNHIRKNLSKEKKTGWVETINVDDPMYYDNFIKNFSPDDEISVENLL